MCDAASANNISYIFGEYTVRLGNIRRKLQLSCISYKVKQTNTVFLIVVSMSKFSLVFKFSDCPFVQLYVSLASSPGLRAP